MGWKGTKPLDFAFQVENETADRARDIILDTLQMLIVSSPVDTGAYRYSHMFRTGSVDTGVREGNGDAISANMPQVVKFRIGHVGYISNSLPYAERLENGWSQQAPKGIYSKAFNYIAQKYGK